MADRMSEPVTAREIYDAYPDSDLLPVERPAEGISIDEWHTHVEETGQLGLDMAGDSLFSFVVSELRISEGCGTRDEAVARLQGAADQLQTVMARVMLGR